MSEQTKPFANKLVELINAEVFCTPKIEILAALDEQRVNVLRWIEAERAKVDKYLQGRKP